MKKANGNMVTCDHCAGSGLKSQVRFTRQASMVAIDTFYDEEGHLHVHNPNTFTTRFLCANGHHWEEVERAAKCGHCEA
jgi:hypothetical protein